MMISDNQLPKETQQKINRLISLTEKLLPLQKWGFLQSAKFGGMPYELPPFLDDGSFPRIKCPVIIYDSKWCRIKLTIAEDENDNLCFYYGRSHAPNNEWRLEWQGENCNCWYDFYYYNLALKFLDGLSPEKALADRKQAKIISDFYHKEMSITLPTDPFDDIEMDLRLQALIWENYGDRLFEIFDLNRPKVWSQYVNFLHELERLRLPSYSVNLAIC